jgi:hypothetical protein
MLSAIQSAAASRSDGSARARSMKPAPRRGKSTSRIAISGTRAISRSWDGSGLTNARIRTSAGISWAANRGPTASTTIAAPIRSRRVLKATFRSVYCRGSAENRRHSSA